MIGSRPRVLVAHGPNLGRLGQRQPAIYGSLSLEALRQRLEVAARDLDCDLEHWQGNGEGALIDRLEAGIGRVDAAVLNPGAYGHTSVALRDCVAALPYPVVEVHLTNPLAREGFRHRLVLAEVAAGLVAGLGPEGYLLALRAACALARGALPEAGR